MKTLLLSFVIFLGTSAAGTPSVPAIPFFDGHVHLNDLEMQNQLMAQTGVDRAVVFWGGRSDNVDMLKAAEKFKGKFFPFVSVSPERRNPYGTWWKNSDSALLKYLEGELKSKKYFGIGELSIVHFPSSGFPENEFSPLHPLMKGILKLAEKYSMPVLIHCEITYVKELAKMLSEFPKVSIVWAHGGYADYYITQRMMAEHDNLTIELSMRMREHPRSPDYWIMKDTSTVWGKWLDLIRRYPHRFVVGSDASHHSLGSDRSKVESMQLLLGQLPRDIQACVGTSNLESLIGIGTSTCSPSQATK